MVRAGAVLGDDGRVRFPRTLVEDMLAVAARDITICGREERFDLCRLWHATKEASWALILPVLDAFETVARDAKRGGRPAKKSTAQKATVIRTDSGVTIYTSGGIPGKRKSGDTEGYSVRGAWSLAKGRAVFVVDTCGGCGERGTSGSAAQRAALLLADGPPDNCLTETADD